jgi:hypothetical protein
MTFSKENSQNSWNVELIGKRVGLRVILSRAPDRGDKVYCNVICDCGRKDIVRLSGISGKCRHCAGVRHGLSFKPLRRQWHELRGAGRLCPEWADWGAFLEYVGPDNLESRIQRIDASRVYGPGNVLLKAKGV